MRLLNEAVTGIRNGITLVELVVVLVILAGMIGLLLPALQHARESGRSTICVNNLRQLGIAARNHWELTHTFPVPGESWTVTLLPWMEERPLADEIKLGRRERAIGSRPPIFRCPSQEDPAANDTGVLTCHYTLLVGKAKKGGLVRWNGIRDRPRDFATERLAPWYIGPIGGSDRQGPHSGGRYNSS